MPMRVGELRQGAEAGGCAEDVGVTHTPEMVNSGKPLWWCHLQVCQWGQLGGETWGAPAVAAVPACHPTLCWGSQGHGGGNTATESVEGPRLNNPTC